MLIRETQHLIFHDVSSCMPTANRSKFHNWSARDQKNNLTSPSTHSISGESLYKRACGLCSTHEDQTGFTCLSGHWCSKLYTLLCLHLVVSNLTQTREELHRKFACTRAHRFMSTAPFSEGMRSIDSGRDERSDYVTSHHPNKKKRHRDHKQGSRHTWNQRPNCVSQDKIVNFRNSHCWFLLKMLVQKI